MTDRNETQTMQKIDNKHDSSLEYYLTNVGYQKKGPPKLLGHIRKIKARNASEDDQNKIQQDI